VPVLARPGDSLSPSSDSYESVHFPKHGEALGLHDEFLPVHSLSILSDFWCIYIEGLIQFHYMLQPIDS
jgi:hypothetical protein